MACDLSNKGVTEFSVTLSLKKIDNNPIKYQPK